MNSDTHWANFSVPLSQTHVTELSIHRHQSPTSNVHEGRFARRVLEACRSTIKTRSCQQPSQPKASQPGEAFPNSPSAASNRRRRDEPRTSQPRLTMMHSSFLTKIHPAKPLLLMTYFFSYDRAPSLDLLNLTDRTYLLCEGFL